MSNIQQDVQVLWGDCLDLLDQLPDDSIDLVLTDPPYFTPPQQFVSNRSKHKRSLANSSLLEHFYNSFFDKLIPKVKQTGSIYIFCSERSYPLYWLFLYERVKKIRMLIWDKGTSVNGYSWRHQHIPILMAEMFDYPAIKTGDGDVLKEKSVPIKTRFHPAQKPLTLLRRIIEKSTKEGDLVLDPFGGSCSTVEAAVACKRKAIAMELNIDHALAAAGRLNVELVGLPSVAGKSL